MGGAFGYYQHVSDTALSDNGGRPKVTSGEARVVLAKRLHADKSLDIDDICKTLRISRSTFYRYVAI